MSLPETSAAIIAGGRARRFGGQDKSRLLVRGRPIIVRQVTVLQQVAAEIFVVAGEAARFADLGLVAHADRRPGCGVLGGLHTAVTVAAHDPVIAVAGDLPFLSEALLRQLVTLALEPGMDAAWVRGPRGPEPLLACYRRAAEPALRAAIDAGRLRAGDLDRVLRIAEIPDVDLARFGPRDELLANVNTPDDLARVQ
ncbi:MAG: molybdenum cofactor guanylyltransferase [Vicinamibacterales bacterium]